MKVKKPQGLYKKYFVLSPWKDDIYGEASREAIKAYAKVIEPVDRMLYYDLENWVTDIESEIRKQRNLNKGK